MFFIKLFTQCDTIKRKIKLSQLKKCALIGTNVSVLSMFSCQNLTEKKNNVIIHDNVELGCSLYVIGEGKIVIGNNTTIRYQTELLSTIGIFIGSNVIISNNCVLFDNNTHPTSPQQRLKMSKSGFNSELWSSVYAEKKEIVIHDNVWIGQRAMIMKGVTIGRGAIVAAGAIVTKDIPEYSIVAGNPAVVVKYLYGLGEAETHDFVTS